MIITGVTKRTLHYYHEVGLLIPSHILTNGRRKYSQHDLIKLQKIIFLKSIGLKIKEISSIISEDDTYIRQRVMQQKEIIQQQISYLSKMNKELNKFINGTPLVDIDIYQYPLSIQYAKEAQIKYETTNEYQEFTRRRKTLSNAEKNSLEDEVEQSLKSIFSELANNRTVKDPNTKRLVMDWKNTLLKQSNFEDAILIQIASLYSTDPRYENYFQQYGQNFHMFLTETISYHLKKN